MIAALYGIVELITPPLAIINVQGVGYQVFCTQRCEMSLSVGEKASLVIHTEVREDSIKLFGFADSLEKEVFLLLTKVKGVAAKSALEIVSLIERRELLRTIAEGDIAKLTSVKGVGKKTAERIVLELKDRVSEYVDIGRTLKIETSNVEGKVLKEAVQALQVLGFTEKDAVAAVKQAAGSSALVSQDPGQVVKEALRFV